MTDLQSVLLGLERLRYQCVNAAAKLGMNEDARNKKREQAEACLQAKQLLEKAFGE
jgi:uncharacterized protein YeaC (DUF1315 family)